MPAAYDDLLGAPPHSMAQIVDGEAIVPSGQGREKFGLSSGLMTTRGNASLAAYRDIFRVARRLVHTDADAHDLVHDALMIALDRGFRDWSSAERRPWLHGVLRRRAAFVARTEGRRRRRERIVVETTSTPTAWTWQPAFLTALPPSLRVVAMLARADLCAVEIRWLLQLSPEALRSRLSALRRAVHAQAELPIQPAPEPQTSLGARRAPVLASLKRLHGRALATHDPDGHIILFRVVPHKNGMRGNS